MTKDIVDALRRAVTVLGEIGGLDPSKFDTTLAEWVVDRAQRAAQAIRPALSAATLIENAGQPLAWMHKHDPDSVFADSVIREMRAQGYTSESLASKYTIPLYGRAERKPEEAAELDKLRAAGDACIAVFRDHSTEEAILEPLSTLQAWQAGRDIDGI